VQSYPELRVKFSTVIGANKIQANRRIFVLRPPMHAHSTENLRYKRPPSHPLFSAKNARFYDSGAILRTHFFRGPFFMEIQRQGIAADRSVSRRLSPSAFDARPARSAVYFIPQSTRICHFLAKSSEKNRSLPLPQSPKVPEIAEFCGFKLILRIHLSRAPF
jgi:hypothetical protein